MWYLTLRNWNIHRNVVSLYSYKKVISSLPETWNFTGFFFRGLKNWVVLF